MSNISIIEFLVYGFMAYSSMLVLIISTVKEAPMTKSLSIIRSIYLIPGMICSAILSSSGVNIVWVTTINTIKDLNSSTVWTENTTNNIVLQGSAWSTVHLMIFLVLLTYVISQILIFFTKTE